MFAASDSRRVDGVEVHPWGWSPVVDAVVPSVPKVFEHVAHTMVVDGGRAGAVLGASDNAVAQVRAARDHGVNELADAIPVSEAHGLR